MAMKVRYEGELVIGDHIRLRFDGLTCHVLVGETDISSDCTSLTIHLEKGRPELRLRLAPHIRGELLARQELGHDNGN